MSIADSLRRKAALEVLTRWPTVVESVSKHLQPVIKMLPEEQAQIVTDVYEQWTGERAVESPEAKPEMPGVKLEDASQFLQYMAAVEGQLRLDVCNEGCRCKMAVQASAIREVPGAAGAVAVSVFTLHDPICPWLQKVREGTNGEDPKDDTAPPEESKE